MGEINIADALARQTALGAVVLESATWSACSGGCSLPWSGVQYAPVVYAGQNTMWLIENCTAIVKIHQEITGVAGWRGRRDSP